MFSIAIPPALQSSTSSDAKELLWYDYIMSAGKLTGADGSPLKYKRVPSAGLKASRKGRHHELMAGILNDLATLPAGSAIQVPLNSVRGLSLGKLRSAVVRASAKHGVSIETSSDSDNFYIWKAKAGRTS